MKTSGKSMSFGQRVRVVARAKPYAAIRGKLGRVWGIAGMLGKAPRTYAVAVDDTPGIAWVPRYGLRPVRDTKKARRAAMRRHAAQRTSRKRHAA